ncbi:MAG: hypothetical protein KDC38_00125 [Planctomycetes bacterium]|nr:hypothetical protein [Planctomycetota bacterium]
MSRLLAPARARAVVLFALALAPTILSAQTFERTIGTPLYDYASSIVRTPDGGYMTAGSELYDCCCPNDTDGWLMKLFPNGTVDFRIALDIDLFDHAAAVRYVDGDAFGPGYVVTGHFGSTAYYDPGNRSVFVARTDINGVVLWIYEYGIDPAADYSFRLDLEVVHQFDPVDPAGGTPDGYIVAGARVDAAGEQEGFLLRIDPAGALVWMNSYRDQRFPTSWGAFVDVEQVFDFAGTGLDGFVVTGYSGPGRYDIWDTIVARTDNVGNVIWAAEYGTDTFSDQGLGITPTSDGGFVVTRRGPFNPLAVGDTTTFGAATLKIDGFSVPIWSRADTGMQLTGPVRELPGGDLAMIGWAWASGYTYPQAVLAKLDANGSALWQWRYDGPEPYDSAVSFDLTDDGGYIILADTGLCCHDYFVIRTDDEGRTGCELDLSLTWPDQFVDWMNIDYQLTPFVTSSAPPVMQPQILPNEQDRCDSTGSTPLLPPSDLTCTDNGDGTVALAWVRGRVYGSITIRRNGSPLAVIAGTDVDFEDTLPGPGAYEYDLIATDPATGGTTTSETCAMVTGVTDLVYVNLENIGDSKPDTCELVDRLDDAGRNPCSAYGTGRFLDFAGQLQSSGAPVGLWISLGHFPENHVLTTDEIAQIASILASVAGSSLYIEGGDLGFSAGGEMSSLTGVTIVDTGSAEESILSVTGLDSGLGLDLSGFDASYSGGTTFADHLEASSSFSAPVFVNEGGAAQVTTVYHDASLGGAGTHRTIASSMDFAGYDGDRGALMAAYLGAFSGDLAPVPFSRGDCASDGGVGIGDVIFLLGYLFGGTSTVTCTAACDVDDSGSLNLGDAITLLNFTFAGGAAPAAPYPNCGLDPSSDALGCEDFDSCP